MRRYRLRASVIAGFLSLVLLALWILSVFGFVVIRIPSSRSEIMFGRAVRIHYLVYSRQGSVTVSESCGVREFSIRFRRFEDVRLYSSPAHGKPSIELMGFRFMRDSWGLKAIAIPLPPFFVAAAAMEIYLIGRWLKRRRSELGFEVLGGPVVSTEGVGGGDETGTMVKKS